MRNYVRITAISKSSLKMGDECVVTVQAETQPRRAIKTRKYKDFQTIVLDRNALIFLN